METVGLLLDSRGGRLKEANFGMATAVRGANRRLVALLVDGHLEDARRALEAYGVERIVGITTAPGPGPWNPAVRSSAVVAAMEKFDIRHLVGLTSPTNRELLPRIAAELDAPLVMDCVDIDISGRRAKTSQYSGKVLGTIRLTGQYFIYGLRANVVEPSRAPVSAGIVHFAFEADPADGYQVLETRLEAGSSQDLAEAEIIISGGRGLKSGDHFRLLFDCAKPLGASVGASRVAVDSGWVPYAMQVGQTGVKVNPKVYIAAGISGSVQHFAGMKTAKMIIAVNSDENAPIMANCDYFAVGDLFDILPALAKRLKKLSRDD